MNAKDAKVTKDNKLFFGTGNDFKDRNDGNKRPSNKALVIGFIVAMILLSALDVLRVKVFYDSDWRCLVAECSISK